MSLSFASLVFCSSIPAYRLCPLPLCFTLLLLFLCVDLYTCGCSLSRVSRLPLVSSRSPAEYLRPVLPSLSILPLHSSVPDCLFFRMWSPSSFRCVCSPSQRPSLCSRLFLRFFLLLGCILLFVSLLVVVFSFFDLLLGRRLLCPLFSNVFPSVSLPLVSVLLCCLTSSLLVCHSVMVGVYPASLDFCRPWFCKCTRVSSSLVLSPFSLAGWPSVPFRPVRPGPSVRPSVCLILFPCVSPCGNAANVNINTLTKHNISHFYSTILNVYISNLVSYLNISCICIHPTHTHTYIYIKCIHV